MAAEALPKDIASETRLGGNTIPVQRFSVISPSKDTTGDIGAMALYAGEFVANVRRVQPAAEIVEDLVSGAAAKLRRT